MKFFEDLLLRHFIERIKVDDVIKFIDMAALALEPRCADIVCSPLRRGCMPDVTDFVNTDFSTIQEVKSPLQAELHWCISEFVFSVTSNQKLLVGWEKIYLLFCFWHSETWICCDEDPRSLATLVTTVIKINNTKFSNLLLDYFRTLKTENLNYRHFNSDGLDLAIKALETDIAFCTKSNSMEEWCNIYKNLFTDNLDSDIKSAWISAAKEGWCQA